jgi:hypothetical protein
MSGAVSLAVGSRYNARFLNVWSVDLLRICSIYRGQMHTATVQSTCSICLIPLFILPTTADSPLCSIYRGHMSGAFFYLGVTDLSSLWLLCRGHIDHVSVQFAAGRCLVPLFNLSGADISGVYSLSRG